LAPPLIEVAALYVETTIRARNTTRNTLGSASLLGVEDPISAGIFIVIPPRCREFFT
jgi:hypothetical protein